MFCTVCYVRKRSLHCAVSTVCYMYFKWGYVHRSKFRSVGRVFAVNSCIDYYHKHRTLFFTDGPYGKQLLTKPRCLHMYCTLRTCVLRAHTVSTVPGLFILREVSNIPNTQTDRREVYTVFYIETFRFWVSF